MEIKNLAELYDAPPMEWEQVRAGLDRAFAPGADEHGYIGWLTTINPDGSPHTTSVGVAWEDGAFWFQTGRNRKTRNIARDARCSMARQLPELDLTVEGTAVEVTDPRSVSRLARHWADRGWPAEPDETGTALTAPYNAQSTGPGPWHVYRIDLTSAFAVMKVEPYGATRWRF